MEMLLKEPSLSPSKQIKSKRKINHQPYHHHHNQNNLVTARLPNIWRQSSCGSIVHQKYAPPPHVQLEMVQLAALAAGGVFFNHYPRQISHSSSLPPILPATFHQHLYHHQNDHQHQQKPPLLPLPVASKPAFRSLPPPSSLTRSHSVAGPTLPRKQQPNKTKATKNTTAATTKTTTVKKKPTHQNSKKENEQDETQKKLLHEDRAEKGVGPAAKGAGPDPGSLPKEFMTRVLSAADLNKGQEVAVANNNNNNNAEKLTTPSIYNLLVSPPPSSLPLPKFTMRQNKLSCNAEAAADGVDTGATDNLCRLLKLR